MTTKFLLLSLSLLIILFSSLSSARAENSKSPYLIRDVSETEGIKKTRLILPYAFYSETYEFAVGVGGGATGFQEGQMGLYASGLYTTNDTYALYFLGNDIRIPYTKRLYLDPFISYGWYAVVRDYIDGNPDYPDERAGSNDSSADNYIFDSGYNNTVELRFKYVLPFGKGRDSALQHYILDRGILAEGASGGGAWNPVTGGVTYLQFKPFYHYRTFDFPDETLKGSTGGLEVGLHYDNRDLPINPSAGSKLHLTYSGDFGTEYNWSVVKGQFSKYLSLGKSENFRQRVVALTFWAADNTSLKTTDTPNGFVADHRAPPMYGASLGGLYRLRAYPQYRFHDKVAIYYGAEYRAIPTWRPLKNVRLLKPLDVDWWQIVGIAELGRVDNGWSFETLYKDLHWSLGAGLRLMARKVVLRLDGAVSNEGATMWVMAGQSF